MNRSACWRWPRSSPPRAWRGRRTLPSSSPDVYFSLNDVSPAARDALVAACKKYLTGHEGTVAFSAGVLAAELNRPVNDRDFDVALHITFASRAAHDQYQDAPRHKQFIEENQNNWKKVRVFDSLVDGEVA